MPENQLKTLIIRIADAFQEDQDIDVDEALSVIAQAKTSLESTYRQYQRNCPPEAKSAAEALSSSVTLFYGALGYLEEYSDSCEDQLLELARTEAERASILLEQALDWAESVAKSNNPRDVH